jgi:hypothetical protein
MKQIRKKVFETNSSSSHSVYIDRHTCDRDFTSMVPDITGAIILEGGEFESNFSELSTSIDRANYAAVEFAELGDESLTQMLIDVIKEQTGASRVVITFSKGCFNNELGGDQVAEAISGPEDLRDFVFSKHSKVTCNY